MECNEERAKGGDREGQTVRTYKANQLDETAASGKASRDSTPGQAAIPHRTWAARGTPDVDLKGMVRGGRGRLARRPRRVTHFHTIRIAANRPSSAVSRMAHARMWRCDDLRARSGLVTKL
jgi:hypothetical protein